MRNCENCQINKKCSHIVGKKLFCRLDGHSWKARPMRKENKNKNKEKIHV
jgi:hypothetical protein